MPDKLKTCITWLFVIFLVLFVANSPSQAANVVRTIWNLVYMIVAGFAAFFSELTTTA